MTDPTSKPPQPENEWTQYNNLAAYVDEHETPQALALGEMLIDLFHPRSVIDVGCSSGIYLVPFQEAGLQYFGIDGANGIDIGRWCQPNFAVVDLRQPWWQPNLQYDLALCIEVLEHIAPEYADQAVANLCLCAPRLFVSAAHPGQGGTSHLNEQPFQYWEEKFARQGFVLDRAATQTIMLNLEADPVYEHCGWLRWHSWIFIREVADHA